MSFSMLARHCDGCPAAMLLAVRWFRAAQPRYPLDATLASARSPGFLPPDRSGLGQGAAYGGSSHQSFEPL